MKSATGKAIIIVGLSVAFLVFSAGVYFWHEDGSADMSAFTREGQYQSDAMPYDIVIGELIKDDFELFEWKSAPSVFEPYFILDEEKAQPPTVDIHTDIYPQNTLTVTHNDYQMSDELRDKIETLIRNYPRRVAFYVLTLDETMSFGYNPDAVFPTASTIKAPYALYCYKQINEGNANLRDTKVYEPRFYSDGSGILYKRPTGGVYTIEQLLYYALFYSDNVAYYMLIDHFKRDGYNEMLEELRTTNLYLRGGRSWSETCPRDSVIAWREIYAFTGSCSEGGILFDALLNATANLLDGALPHYSTLHKSGWTPAEYHDAGVVFAERPYYITIMTNGSTKDRVFVSNLIRAADEVVAEYHAYMKGT